MIAESDGTPRSGNDLQNYGKWGKDCHDTYGMRRQLQTGPHSCAGWRSSELRKMHVFLINFTRRKAANEEDLVILSLALRFDFMAIFKANLNVANGKKNFFLCLSNWLICIFNRITWASGVVMWRMHPFGTQLCTRAICQLFPNSAPF